MSKPTYYASAVIQEIDKWYAEQDWIFCDDRLPYEDDIEDKLLKVVDEETEETYYDIGYYRGVDTDGKYMFDNAYHGWIQGRVIAWSYLPDKK